MKLTSGTDTARLQRLGYRDISAILTGTKASGRRNQREVAEPSRQCTVVGSHWGDLKKGAIT
jgi:hypothetical protein